MRVVAWTYLAIALGIVSTHASTNDDLHQIPLRADGQPDLNYYGYKEMEQRRRLSEEGKRAKEAAQAVDEALDKCRESFGDVTGIPEDKKQAAIEGREKEEAIPWINEQLKAIEDIGKIIPPEVNIPDSPPAPDGPGNPKLILLIARITALKQAWEDCKKEGGMCTDRFNKLKEDLQAAQAQLADLNAALYKEKTTLLDLAGDPERAWSDQPDASLFPDAAQQQSWIGTQAQSLGEVYRKRLIHVDEKHGQCVQEGARMQRQIEEQNKKINDLTDEVNQLRQKNHRIQGELNTCEADLANCQLKSPDRVAAPEEQHGTLTRHGSDLNLKTLQRARAGSE